MTGADLPGVFGMFEMECAAARLLGVLDSLLTNVVRFRDMTTEAERNGFLHLLVNGWLDHAYCMGKDAWLPTGSFYDRIYMRAEHYRQIHPRRTPMDVFNEYMQSVGKFAKGLAGADQLE